MNPNAESPLSDFVKPKRGGGELQIEDAAYFFVSSVHICSALNTHIDTQEN